jgi:beta-aspartyl-peptidase (threonine type)
MDPRVTAIVVHGGAGTLPPERRPAAVAACRAAAEAGHAVLAAGGRALDAVQAAVRVLEDAPELNAGTGAVLTRDGTVELDAAIMDGATLAIGAIAAVPDLRAPIDVARAVMDDGEHVLLAGPAALRFAAERGITTVPTASLVTERSRARWQEETARRAGLVTAPASEHEGGTVGAVAVDRDGHVAAATSTGGINWKRSGRVGDTPLPGCGTWADDRGGAASATGDGEAIIRVTLCRALVDRFERGEDPDLAAAAVLDELRTRGRGTGGVIAVTPGGHVVVAHASETMTYAAIVGEGVGRRQASGFRRQAGGLGLEPPE